MNPLFYVIEAIIFWPIGNAIGWALFSRTDGHPFNWRALVWAGTYSRWLERNV